MWTEGNDASNAGLLENASPLEMSIQIPIYTFQRFYYSQNQNDQFV
jgi:hypothetical protein